MKLLINDELDTEPPVRLSLAEDNRGNVVLLARQKTLNVGILRINQDGTITRFSNAPMSLQDMGFPIDARGRVCVEE